MNPSGLAAALEARRTIGSRLLEDGMTPAEVARELGVTWTTADRWRRRIEADGLAGLAARRRPGMVSRLTQNQRQKLVKILLKGPLAAGYATDLWTCRRVAQVIHREFGVSYHAGHVWKILRSLGWTPQKPEQRFRKRNEEAARRWRNREWPRIKDRLKKGRKSC